MLSQAEFLEMLNVAHDVPNYYSNKWPKNLGYFDGKRYSFDCWNLVKVILAGWMPTGVAGSKTDPTVTGDVDGATLLARCTHRSKDFSKISVPGTYLYYAASPHAGVFVGEFQKNGKIYNVIECTRGMYAGQDGVTYSYVGPDGSRCAWKGAPVKCKWTEYGLLTKYVEYPGVPVERPILKRGSKGEDVRYLQTKLVGFGYDPKGIDGEFGPGCEAAVKQFQKDNSLVVDGIVGPATWGVIDGNNVQKPHTSVNESKDEEPLYHTVKDNEILSSISKKYKVAQSKILALNPDIKNPNLIYAGQKIRIK